MIRLICGDLDCVKVAWTMCAVIRSCIAWIMEFRARLDRLTPCSRCLVNEFDFVVDKLSQSLLGG